MTGALVPPALAATAEGHYRPRRGSPRGRSCVADEWAASTAEGPRSTRVGRLCQAGGGPPPLPPAGSLRRQPGRRRMPRKPSGGSGDGDRRAVPCRDPERLAKARCAAPDAHAVVGPGGAARGLPPGRSARQRARRHQGHPVRLPGARRPAAGRSRHRPCRRGYRPRSPVRGRRHAATGLQPHGAHGGSGRRDRAHA